MPTSNFVSQESNQRLKTNEFTRDQSTSDGDKKAILVSKKLLVRLRSAVARERGPYDRLPSDRELLDIVILQMSKVLWKTPLYSKVVPEQGEVYKYFGSEIVDELRSASHIRDVGRFVDACIIGYLFGREGFQRYCIAGRVIYPQQLGEEKRREIEQLAAEIADAEAVESTFSPGSLRIEG